MLVLAIISPPPAPHRGLFKSTLSKNKASNILNVLLIISKLVNSQVFKKDQAVSAYVPIFMQSSLKTIKIGNWKFREDCTYPENGFVNLISFYFRTNKPFSPVSSFTAHFWLILFLSLSSTRAIYLCLPSRNLHCANSLSPITIVFYCERVLTHFSLCWLHSTCLSLQRIPWCADYNSKLFWTKKRPQLYR